MTATPTLFPTNATSPKAPPESDSPPPGAETASRTSANWPSRDPGVEAHTDDSHQPPHKPGSAPRVPLLSEHCRTFDSRPIRNPLEPFPSCLRPFVPPSLLMPRTLRSARTSDHPRRYIHVRTPCRPRRRCALTITRTAMTNRTRVACYPKRKITKQTICVLETVRPKHRLSLRTEN